MLLFEERVFESVELGLSVVFFFFNVFFLHAPKASVDKPVVTLRVW